MEGVRDWIRDGHQKKIYPNGTEYVGFIKDGDPISGILTFPDGTKYEGRFRLSMSNRQIGIWLEDSEADGQGALTYPDGTKYEGRFEFGLADGQGTLTYPDGTKKEVEFELENLLTNECHQKIMMRHF